jgi:glycerol kinase
MITMTTKRRKGKKHILILDIGTTGVKGIVFDDDFAVVSLEYVSLKKNSEHGRIEQNPKELLLASKQVLRRAISKSKLHPRDFGGIGITNQRETTILWDAATGRPVYPAIVWEDVRTRAFCEGLPPKRKREITQKTGLAADPYFSATKIRWILKNVPQARVTFLAGKLLFGTVDAWLLWNFAEGNPHVTDYTNASRTLLFDIQKLTWDDGLISIFEIPKNILPAVRPSVGKFGILKKDILGFSLPILAVCGDQQASLYAAGTERGTTKMTYGTGAFVGQIIGTQFAIDKPFFTTLAAYVRRPVYALEAKIDGCGAMVRPFIGNPVMMKKTVSSIVRAAARYLKRLPIKPRVVIVDGGVTQYPELISLQEKASGMRARKQNIYDGTALGAAMLVKKGL